jgi:Uma2 family endonuclease
MRARTLRTEVDPDTLDQCVRLHDVGWDVYEALVTDRGESSVPRMSYLEGELELMTPGADHEWEKTLLARLFEAWSDEVGIDVDGYGSWTIKEKRRQRGAEPDECYVLPEPGRPRPKAPHIAIEVVKTSGGIDKLEIYRKLGVREVWFWEDGKLTFHLLRGEHYLRATRSALVPSLDPRFLVRFMKPGSQAAAVRALRKAMRAAKKKGR